jgi:hypothetical protein
MFRGGHTPRVDSLREYLRINTVATVINSRIGQRESSWREIAAAVISVGEGVAARQRTRSSWPFIGLGLVALLSSSAQVEAYRSTVASGGGHINMGFVLGPGLTHADSFLDLLVFLCLTAALLHLAPPQNPLDNC